MAFHRLLHCTVAVVLAIFAAPSFAGFSGSYAPSNWSTTLTGTPPGGGGAAVDTSGAPNQIVLIGGDDDCDDDCELQYTTSVAATGTLSFNWSYSTTDVDGPEYDVFIILHDGSREQLSDDAGPATQSGSKSLNVSAGDTFGFALNCEDCIEGAAEVTISAFNAPEPAVATEATAVPTLPLWGLALLTLLLLVIVASQRRHLKY
ncbi:IPTL-CTERM sorting domain-containing protein [Parahaliea sp. F7430]|uniref:IPTL-CTERM sorting domain-containing protein n=1 Tax=Sediminihaliea albiluteola TaxID=2758564 RepID=A0A7W2YI25_9GAMM|nr:IPTL-CTERM sorting domain-containing protein [Sediminihaliea albiluteola]MBA6411607.1 IPTL-CTERM sorting domain-containing protein [Sediminihaliea albiluteola]